MMLETEQSVFIKIFVIFFQCGTFINVRTGKLNFPLLVFRFFTNILILSSTIYCSSGFNQQMIFKSQDFFPALMFILMDALVAIDRKGLVSLLKFLSEPFEVNEVKNSYDKVLKDYNRIIHGVSQIAGGILVIGTLTWACIPLPYLLKLNIKEVEESGECFHLSFGWLPVSYLSVSVIVVIAVISGIMCILNTMLLFAWSLQLLFTVLKLKVELRIICIDILFMDNCRRNLVKEMLESGHSIPMCNNCLSKTLCKSNVSKLHVKFLDQCEIFDFLEPRECCMGALNEGIFLYGLRKRFKGVIERHNRVIKLVEMTNRTFNLQIMMFCQLAVPVGALIIANTESNLSAIEYINRGIHITGVFNLSAHYNFCGQMLLDESDRLRETLYSFDWMDKPWEIQRAVHMMQIAANRSLRLTSGRLHNLSLESYTKVLSAVYSYTNVLQSLRG